MVPSFKVRFSNPHLLKSVEEPDYKLHDISRAADHQRKWGLKLGMQESYIWLACPMPAQVWNSLEAGGLTIVIVGGNLGCTTIIPEEACIDKLKSRRNMFLKNHVLKKFLYWLKSNIISIKIWVLGYENKTQWDQKQIWQKLHLNRRIGTFSLVGNQKFQYVWPSRLCWVIRFLSYLPFILFFGI